MNRTAKQIAAYCQCSIEWAMKIQEQMGHDGVDFSECTKGEFQKAIIKADSFLLLNGNVSPFDTVKS